MPIGPDWLFWMTFPGFLAQPIFSTAVAFQQAHLAALKGWSHAGFAALFSVMTVATITSLAVAGWAIDRFGPTRVTPVMLLPAAAGYALLVGVCFAVLALGWAVFRRLRPAFPDEV